MKKFVAMALVLTMALSLFAGCGKGNTTETEAPGNAVPVDTSALEILENIWAQYGDEEKFSVIGGNMENPQDGVPGSYDMTYAENLSYNLVIPADSLASVDEAATMVHMMNANTFTAGVVHLTAGTDAAAFVDTMKNAIKSNQWICGFPETVVIAVVEAEYVVIAFGAGDLLGTFANHLAGAYANAQVLVNEPVEG